MGEGKGRGWVRSVNWGKEVPLQSPWRGSWHPNPEQRARLGGEAALGPAGVIVWRTGPGRLYTSRRNSRCVLAGVYLTKRL